MRRLTDGGLSTLNEGVSVRTDCKDSINMEPRYLITTADERTWVFDRPVVFLGEWCRIFEREHIWQNMDAIVAAPYGLGLKNKDADHAEARVLEDRIFVDLIDTLNQHHGVKHGERFWKIVLGHWLRRFVDVMINRIKTLEQCIQTYKISGTAAYVNECYSLATQDSYSAILAYDDNRWNVELNNRILGRIGFADYCKDSIFDEKSANFYLAPHLPSAKRKVHKRFIELASKLSTHLVRDNDAFIINSYLPKKEEIKLQFALLQFPQLWGPANAHKTIRPDQDLRNRLAGNIESESKYRLERILRAMLFELIPICYLEGFSSLNENIKQLPWPSNPKFIFTSNNFDFDEIFKLWAATKIELGSKYYIGQHGNNYGTHRYMYPAIEEETADKFLTWGWTDGLPQHTPAFVLKNNKSKSVRRNLKTHLLLAELHCNRRISLWDGVSEFQQYFEDQHHFVRLLHFRPKSQLIVRLHGGHRDLEWNEVARWQAIDPSLSIDDGAVNIKSLIAKSRLVVHSYDSTGILETLSQNIPTLAFWQNGFEHLRESAKPYYQILVDAGIVHLSAESVAAKVNDVWDDVDGWRWQDNVQIARRKFCERYARPAKESVKEILKIFSEETL